MGTTKAENVEFTEFSQKLGFFVFFVGCLEIKNTAKMKLAEFRDLRPKK